MTTFSIPQNKIKNTSAIAKPVAHIFTASRSTSRRRPKRLSLTVWGDSERGFMEYPTRPSTSPPLPPAPAVWRDVYWCSRAERRSLVLPILRSPSPLSSLSTLKISRLSPPPAFFSRPEGSGKISDSQVPSPGEGGASGIGGALYFPLRSERGGDEEASLRDWVNLSYCEARCWSAVWKLTKAVLCGAGGVDMVGLGARRGVGWRHD